MQFQLSKKKHIFTDAKTTKIVFYQFDLVFYR